MVSPHTHFALLWWTTPASDLVFNPQILRKRVSVILHRLLSHPSCQDSITWRHLEMPKSVFSILQRGNSSSAPMPPLRSRESRYATPPAKNLIGCIDSLITLPHFAPVPLHRIPPDHTRPERRCRQSPGRNRRRLGREKASSDPETVEEHRLGDPIV